VDGLMNVVIPVVLALVLSSVVVMVLEYYKSLK